MTHQVLERRVVGIRQGVDTLVQPNVPRPLVLVPWEGRATISLTRMVRRADDYYSLAASMKSWCWLAVNSGSGSSRSQSLRTLVTLLISDDHSSASRFTDSRSAGMY